MRALIMFVSGLAIIVAFLAATTERRQTLSVNATPDARAAENVSTGSSPATVESSGATGVRNSDDVAPTRAPSGSAEGVTVEQAASRIGATSGRPSIVILYGTACPLTRQMFAEFVAMTRRHPGVEILAFATDEESSEEVPGFLREHGAGFRPTYIRNWPAGALTQAMAPLGIEAGATWTRPLVAVRDAQGRVISQGQGVTNVAAVEQALAQLR